MLVTLKRRLSLAVMTIVFDGAEAAKAVDSTARQVAARREIRIVFIMRLV
jgi:hypothetical protein